MMNSLFEWIARVVGSWKFWIVIAPWDVAIRIRLGKTGVPLLPGLHLRVPFIDEITLVNTRQRISSVPPVTMPTAMANVTRCVSAVVGFAVVDPLAAMLRYTYPDVYIASYIQSIISRGISAEQCEIMTKSEFSGSGLEIQFVRYVEDVEVRSYRFLNSGGGGYFGAGIAPSMSVGDRVQHY